MYLKDKFEEITKKYTRSTDVGPVNVTICHIDEAMPELIKAVADDLEKRDSKVYVQFCIDNNLPF